MDILLAIVLETWRLTMDTAPWVLLGLFVAGLLKAFLPGDFLARHLGRTGAASVFKATLIGLPLPLCSCGVLPVAAGLRRQGASKGATTAFLIATPETGVDSFTLTWALLDPIMAILRPISAFVTAIVAGLAVDRLGKGQAETAEDLEKEAAATEHIAHTCCSGHGDCSGGHEHSHAHTHSYSHTHSHPNPKGGFWARLRLALSFSTGELLADLGGWLLMGLLLGGAIGALLPPDFFQTWAGEGLLSMLVMLAAGIPLYMCATSSTPVAAALALKGISPGAALVFLLAGPATNMGTLAVTSRMLGMKAVVVYLSSIAVVTVGMGLTINELYAGLGMSTTHWVAGALEGESGLVGLLSASLLVGMIGLHSLRWAKARFGRAATLTEGSGCCH